jgi:hypothetical protein
VVEEVLVTLAQIVKAGLPCRRLDEAVLRALPPAPKSHIAVPAVVGKAVTLCGPEATLLVRCDQINQVSRKDVTETVVWSDEMVARVHVSVVLDGKSVSTRFGEDAQSGSDPQPRSECGLKALHRNLSYVVQQPLVKHGN